MKRAAMAMVVLALATAMFAQQAAPQGGAAGQSGQPGAAAQAAAPQTGKHPPQAKTQPEFEAYKTAVASANDPAAFEKAATDFATKFPDSELRILLFQGVMRSYQGANNADKMLEFGRKVLELDPDQPEALVGVAEVLVERTRDTDLDKDQRWEEASKKAKHAVDTVDTDLAIPADTPKEKVDAYKGYLRSNAYSILGTIEFNKEQFSDAEGYFRKSVDALPAQPDPIVVLRLALSLDRQGKYPEALKEANHAVELTQEATVPGRLARQERDRLVQLTGGKPAAQAK